MKNKKTNSSISKGVAKVPVIMQLEALECGAACLAMVLAYFGKWVPLEKVRADCGVNRDGSNAVNILKAARNYRLKADGYKMEPDEIKESGSFPCIIHWNFNHFVVLKGIKGNKAYINDPANGETIVTMDVFNTSFTGICMTFEPDCGFVADGKEKTIFSYVKKRTDGLFVPILFTILISAVTSIFGVISPAFDRVFYDRLLTGKNPSWEAPFLLGLAGLLILQMVVSVIRIISNYKINGKLNLIGNMSFMWKILHLPMNFFSQRMTGDIILRQNDNSQIANNLVNIISPMFFNIVMMIFYLVVMLRYSVLLTIIGVASVLINALMSKYISKKRVNLTRVQIRDNAKLSSSTITGLKLMETIKSSGAEEGFFEKWAGEYAKLNESTQMYAKKNHILTLIPSVVSSLASSAILGVGVYLTIKGQFTLGLITAFSGLYTSFVNPVTELICGGQTIQELRTQMERIDDVLEYPDDPNIVEINTENIEKLDKLSGEISIKGVTFGYSPLSEPLLKDFNLEIKKGTSVAIVGPSGSGKSTLAKLISGISVPWSGDILFDNKHVFEIDHSVFTSSLAVVDQDIIMFEDTIENNIKMHDDSILDFEMILAAKDAGMHYDIVSRPGGYRHKLTEDGKDFSGGQRQRLEIARVLAEDPTIVVLDEATSALDSKTEFEVVEAIKNRGITCVVIAHRLSTIRDCDEIVVLDNGKIVERGTHDELLSLGGYYSDLINND